MMKKIAISWQTIGLYLLGHLILATGLTLNANSNLGVSPVMSVAFNASQVSGIRLSITIFVYSLLLIVAQFLLLRRRFERFQVLQIVAAFIGSAFLDLVDLVIPNPEPLPLRLIFLFVGITLVGIGASLTVGMKILAHPADALAQTIGLVTHKTFGFGKNILDIVCISLALAISLGFQRGLLGVNMGTAIAMVMTGRVIALVHPFSERLYDKYAGQKQEVSKTP